VIDPSLPQKFAEAVWQAIASEDAGGAENAKRVAKGSAPFVLVEMIAALKGSGSKMIGDVKKVLGEKGVGEEVERGGKKGAALLAEKLAEL
jgi:pumilio family protein 6